MAIAAALLGTAVWCRANERVEFLRKLDEVLPKQGSLFIEFVGPGTDMIGARLGLDISTGAFYRVFRERTHAMVALREPGGVVYDFDLGEESLNPQPAEGETKDRLLVPTTDIQVPPLALFLLQRNPDAVESVTRTEAGYLVTFDRGKVRTWNGLERSSTFPTGIRQGKVMHEYTADLTLLREVRGKSEWTLECKPVEGVPDSIRLPTQTRGDWVLKNAEFVPAGAPERFTLSAVLKAAEPMRSGFKDMRKALGLRDAARGTDALGQPINQVQGDPLGSVPSGGLDWRIVGVVGLVFVGVGGFAWWRHR